VNSFMKKMKPKSDYYDSLLKMEFLYYVYNEKFIIDNATFIKNELPALKKLINKKLNDTTFKIKEIKEFYMDTLVFENTPGFYVNSYLEDVNLNSSRVSIYNYYPQDIIVLGTGENDKYIDFFLHPEPELNQFNGQNEVASLVVQSNSKANFLFFMLKDGFQTYVTQINPWPFPNGITSQQELVSEVNLKDSYIFDRIIEKDIYIRKGDLQVDYPIIIPSGYTVHFDQGTTLDFVNKACFISYSPLIMKGSKNNPVLITSTDSSANGFTIIQAGSLSELSHVRFENLNTLDYKGWTLTGAVTFYESDVEMSNVVFFKIHCEDALNTIRSSFIVKDSRFEFIYGDAFDSDFCEGEVINSSFNIIGNDAIDFSGSTISITGINIDKASDKGISGGEDSYLNVKNSTISRSNIGLASKDLSTVEFSNSKIQDCKYGLVLFKKKPEYGPAKMILNNIEISNVETDMVIEKGSSLLLDQKLIEGIEENVVELLYDL